MNRLQSNLINYSNPLISIGFLFVLGLCAVGAWLFWHESRDDLQQKYNMGIQALIIQNKAQQAQIDDLKNKATASAIA